MRAEVEDRDRVVHGLGKLGAVLAIAYTALTPDAANAVNTVYDVLKDAHDYAEMRFQQLGETPQPIIVGDYQFTYHD